METLTPIELFRFGPLSFTDSAAVSLAISALLVLVGAVLVRWGRAREAAEVVYELLEGSLEEMVTVDIHRLIPLVLTQWLFILSANVVGVLPLIDSPTRDLSVTAALAAVAFAAGHVYAWQAHGVAYLRHYIEPNPIMLPFNIIGELSRTLALALRLFGNVMSGELIAAIALLLAGLLVPIPLMLLGLLTSVVQAYIFGVLTLVFTASAMQVVGQGAAAQEPQGEEGEP
jgi:F-type H+-transporting ATPase subunit a